jgi:deazaflavin-dependent oxidoreductase (nitroreductase family)
MREAALSAMSRGMVRLLCVIGVAWAMRVLWIAYGQKSRAIRLFNRNILNPIALAFSGHPGMPYAVLYHVGRHTGRSYATPLLVQTMKHGWVIPLTYGEMTDWYRNVKMAGRCTLQWQGRRYIAQMPERMDAAYAFPLFPLPLRLALRFAGIRQFVSVTEA